MRLVLDTDVLLSGRSTIGTSRILLLAVEEGVATPLVSVAPGHSSLSAGRHSEEAFMVTLSNFRAPASPLLDGGSKGVGYAGCRVGQPVAGRSRKGRHVEGTRISGRARRSRCARGNSGAFSRRPVRQYLFPAMNCRRAGQRRLPELLRRTVLTEMDDAPRPDVRGRAMAKRASSPRLCSRLTHRHW